MAGKTGSKRHLPRLHTRRPAPRRPVVAEVLEDGTIRPVGKRGSFATRSPKARVRGSGDRYSVGTVNGDGWVLWWERRRLA